MKGDIQRDIEIKKAAMAGAVQIEIAKIGAQAQAATASQESEREGAEKEGSDQMMAAVLETQAKLLATLAAPKVGTLSNGKQIRIETQV